MNDFTYHPQHIPLKWFNKNNGLDSGQVHNITQDSDGLIWFSGPNGLSRYNGNVLENLTKRINLSSHGLRKVIADAEGQLFIATDFGIEILSHGTCHPVSEEWTLGMVNDLAVHPLLGLLFGSSEGLFIFKDKIIKNIFTGSYDHVFVDQTGLIWTYGKAKGLVIYDTEFKTKHTGITAQIDSVLHISHDSDGIICLLTNESLFEVSTDKIVRKTYFKNATAALRIKNDLWLGINNQLMRYSLIDSSWEKPIVINHDCLINDFLIDNFNNIWCATDQHGAIKISALRALIYQPVFNKSCTVFCINKVDDQHCQVAGRNINKLMSTDNFHLFKDLGQLENKIIWDQIQINDQLHLYATDSGIFSLSQGQLNQLFEHDKYLSSQARVIFRRQNQLWIGTRYGLTELLIDEKGNPHVIKQFNLGYVYCIACDAHDQLWIGTLGNGLFIESNNDFIKQKLRFVKNRCNIYCISFNSKNSCALLHDSLISIHHENHNSILITETETLISGWSVVWDEQTIWVGGINGLSQYDINNKLEIRNITALLSQANWEFTTSKSLLMVNNRYLYCGLNSGLAVVDKLQLEDISKNLNTYLDDVIWENAEVSIKDQMDTVKPGNWTVKVKYFSAWYYNEKNLKYQYKLLGFDDDWHATNQSFVQFNSLPIGKYKLIAKAFSPLKGWSGATSLYEFEVSMPLWARGWLNFIYNIFGVFYGGLSNKKRNTTLMQMNQQLEKQLDQKHLEINQAFTELSEANKALHKEANQDQLTGMANRRSFQNNLDSALGISTRSNSPLALLLLDIDNFKTFNDQYGHDVGDLILINIAKVIDSSVRKGDHASRFGGEEFAVILPHTSLNGAKIIASKILHNVANFETKNILISIKNNITLSIGIGVFADSNWENVNSAELIKQTDKGLYLAKKNGKNQYGTVVENTQQ